MATEEHLKYLKYFGIKLDSQGSSEIISESQTQLGGSGDSLTLEFFDDHFDGHQYALHWKNSREDETWNQYYSLDLNMYGWLCPAFQFDLSVPKEHFE